MGVRKIFLDELPHGGKNISKQRINWKRSIGYKVKFIYDDIQGEVEIVNYDRRYLYIKYLDKDVFKVFTGDFRKCGFCRLLNKYTSNFKIEIETHFKDRKRDVIITDRKYRKSSKGRIQKWYKYKCNKCGWEGGWIIEGDLIDGKGCSVCCSSPRTVVPGINDIPTTAPWMVKYFQGGYDEAKKYTNKSGQKICPVCPDCGRIKNKETIIRDIYQKHSIGCTCGDGISYPNKFMFSLLEQLDISFQTEYSPDWIKPKRYDFYFEVESKKYIIEMDGGLGHGKRIHSKGKETIEETLENDNYKDEQAKLNNIEVIRINCDKSELDYIRNNIIDSKLNNIFNLLKTNWLKCEEFALSNLVKLACEIKRNNPSISTNGIAKIMRINGNNIRIYLKQGSKLGWCKYDPKEEMIKSNQRKGKKMRIFKDGISLGVFVSVNEIERQSEKLFGIKLYGSGIYKACRGNKKIYKGFTFSYVV